MYFHVVGQVSSFIKLFATIGVASMEQMSSCSPRTHRTNFPNRPDPLGMFCMGVGGRGRQSW